MDARRNETHDAYEVVTNACIGMGELALLLEAAGYRERAGHLAATLVDRGFAAYTVVAHARDDAGRLVGYVGAFTDGALTTIIATLVVHPDAAPCGVADDLVRAVQRECAMPARMRRTA